MLIPSSFCWPPVECSRGTTPIHAVKLPPLWKPPPFSIAATSAVAVTGPMPGMAEPPAGFVLMTGLLDHRIGLVNPHRQLIKIQLQLGQQAHGARRTVVLTGYMEVNERAFTYRAKIRPSNKVA